MISANRSSDTLIVFVCLFVSKIQVLEITCVDSKSAYDEVKAKRQHPGVADMAGAAVSSVAQFTRMQIQSALLSLHFSPVSHLPVPCGRHGYLQGCQEWRMQEPLR